MPPVPNDRASEKRAPDDRAPDDRAPDASASDAFAPDALSPDAWARVLRVFHDAVARPPAERAAFLDAACDGDAALRRRVAQLLDADDAGDAFTLLGTDGAALDALFADGAPPARIGPYRLGRELGRGGMGVVYAAERDDVGTTVALKFLRERFPSAARLRRFEREQRVLGRLEHPGIARLLDAGVTAAGTPFFAMAYVEGTPLTAYAAAHGLGLRARLRLFRQACDAVAYAHRALVVHRDLKPANIFVTDGPDGPQVKLLDFGIAKLLADEEDAAAHENASDDAGALTRTGEHLLTPAYAAPEQLLGADVTVATDVHALGAVLYELLTGTRPFGDDAAPVADVAHQIVHDAPAPPSSVASAEAGGVARVPADLDAVAAKALRKAPADRYASASDLGDDVGRVLADRPVRARADATGYRLRTFVRRNRGAVAAASAVAVLLVALVGFYTWRLADARDRAERQAAVAEGVSTFLVETLGEGDPNAAAGDTLTIHDVVERATRRADDLADAGVRADVFDALGSVYMMRGRFATADSLHVRSLRLREMTLGADHADVAASLDHLGQVRTLEGRYTEADSLLRRSVALRQRTLGRDDALTGQSLRLLAKARYHQGAYAEADSLYRAAIAIQERTLADDDIQLAETYMQRGMTRFRQGERADAAALYRRAVRIFEAAYPDGHSATASALANLASIERVQGRYDAAQEGYREALTLLRQIHGTRHPDIAVVLNNLAVTHYRQGDLATAIPMMEDNVQMRTELFGPDHPATATAHDNLGEMLVDAGRPDEAEPHLREAVRVREAVFGPTHRRTVVSLTTLAACAEAQGAHAAARARYRNVLARHRMRTEPDADAVATAATGVVRAYLAQGRPADARAFADSVRAAGVDLAAADTLLAAQAR